MEQLQNANLLPWAIAVIALCLVIPLTVPRVLDYWERRQDVRARRAARSSRRI